MKFARRLLTLVLAVCFCLSIFFLIPTNVKAYEDVGKKLSSYDEVLQGFFSDSIAWDDYQKGVYFGAVEKNIAISNARIDLYETQLQNQPDPNVAQDLQVKIDAEKEKLKEFNKAKEKKDANIRDLKQLPATYAKAINQTVVELVKIANDPDHIDYGGMTFRIGMQIVSCWLDKWQLGCLVDTFNGFLMGDASTYSENQEMYRKIEGLIDTLHDDIAKVEKQIKDLSKQIGKQTEEIIGSLSNAIEATSSKERMLEFTSASIGNFSYDNYKNYVLGSSSYAENPRGFKTAYAAKADKLLANGGTKEEVKKAFDELYVNLEPDTRMYYEDYILAKDSIHTQSIGREFYTYLAANRDLLENGSAETAAIDYIYDLYNTAIMADQELIKCYNYQILYMMLEKGGTLDLNDEYVCEDGSIITYEEILGGFNAISSWEADLEKQIVKDIAYIMNADGSYYREIQDGGTQYYTDNNTETFGKLMTGDIVYLNELNQICSTFGLNSTELKYRWYAGGKEVTVDSSLSYFEIGDLSNDNPNYNGTLTAKAYYQTENTVLYTINFEIDSKEGFDGGTGTFDDPYLISDPNQLLRISSEENMDKCFKLIGDVSFKGVKFTPIGTEDAPFDGVFDGNGHTISDISYYRYGTDLKAGGLFGYVGGNGIVKNLNINNSSFTVDSKDSEKVMVGAIAGYSAGLIYNCNVSNTSVSGILKNEPNNENSINRAVNVYAGGIVGLSISATKTTSKYDESSSAASDFFKKLGGYSFAMEETGNIYYCTFNNGKVSANSSRDYSANPDQANQSFAYAGGIAGYLAKNSQIGYCSVYNTGNEFTISSYISSQAKKIGTSYIYAQSYAGGIAGLAANGSKVFKVFSGFAADENDDCTKNITSSTDPYNYGGAGVLWFDLSLNKKECKAYAKKYASGTVASKVTSFSDINYPNEFTDNYDVDYYFAGNSDELFYSDYKEGQYIVSFKDYIEYEDLVLRVGNREYYSESKKMKNSYVIRGYHFLTGFDSLDYTETNEMMVRILFSVVIDGREVLLSKDIKMLAIKAMISGISIIEMPSRINYELDGPADENKFDFNGKISINYSNGLSKIVDFGNNYCESFEDDFLFNGVKLEEFRFNGAGIVTVKISLMEEFVTQYDINVECHHTRNVSNDSCSATCSHEGFSYSYCSDCGSYFNIQQNAEKTGHVHKILVRHEEPTCTKEGYYGDYICDDCGCIVEEGYVLPMKKHMYAEADEHTHICTECGKREEHHFIAIEGEKTITYECVDCGYRSKEVMKTRSELENAPRIIVSDGYSLGGGKEVAIYVSLINNPGITGASFSIVYDENLEYVDFENGSILTNPICVVNDKDTANHIISMTVASDIASYKNGTLIKLIFKTPTSIKQDDGVYRGVRNEDVFEINVTYSNSSKSMFSSPTNKAFDVLTFAGSISVVDHLPGNVNNDDTVDLIDAIEIARYLSKETNSISHYSDLNLDGSTNIDDLTRLLQYLVGGYDAPVQANHYSIDLKYNNKDKEDHPIYVDYYVQDESGNYVVSGMSGLPEGEDMKREGYKFDGWYTEFVGGTKVGNFIAGDDENNYKAYYDSNKYKQALYARYIQNEITFVIDGKEYVYCYNENGNNIVDLDAISAQFTKDIIVKFYYGYAGSGAKILGTLETSCLIEKWVREDNTPETTYKFDLANDEIGKIVLYPVWETIEAPRSGEFFDSMDAKLVEYGNTSGHIIGWGLTYGTDDFDEPITSSMNLFAFVSDIEFTITYNIGIEGLNDTEEDLTPRLTGRREGLRNANELFSREGYKAICWRDEKNKNYYWEKPDGDWTGEVGIANLVPNNTLYVVWEELKYTVTYYGYGVGEKIYIGSEELKYGATIKSDEIYRDGYKFNGWYSDVQRTKWFDFSSPIKSDTLIYGKYTKLNEYVDDDFNIAAGTYKLVATSYGYNIVGRIKLEMHFDHPQGGTQPWSNSYVIGENVKIDNNMWGTLKFYYEGSKPTIDFLSNEHKSAEHSQKITAGNYTVTWDTSIVASVEGYVVYDSGYSGIPATTFTVTNGENFYNRSQGTVKYVIKYYGDVEPTIVFKHS